jgi:hypothetical protein
VTAGKLIAVFTTIVLETVNCQAELKLCRVLDACVKVVAILTAVQSTVNPYGIFSLQHYVIDYNLVDASTQFRSLPCFSFSRQFVKGLDTFHVVKSLHLESDYVTKYIINHCFGFFLINNIILKE